jgi:hypothetical protein
LHDEDGESGVSAGGLELVGSLHQCFSHGRDVEGLVQIRGGTATSEVRDFTADRTLEAAKLRAQGRRRLQHQIEARNRFGSQRIGRRRVFGLAGYGRTPTFDV